MSKQSNRPASDTAPDPFPLRTFPTSDKPVSVWCDSCRDYHPIPRDEQHRAELKCKASDTPAEDYDTCTFALCPFDMPQPHLMSDHPMPPASGTQATEAEAAPSDATISSQFHKVLTSQVEASGKGEDVDDHDLSCGRWVAYDEHHRRYYPDRVCTCTKYLRFDRAAAGQELGTLSSSRGSIQTEASTPLITAYPPNEICESCYEVGIEIGKVAVRLCPRHRSAEVEKLRKALTLIGCQGIGLTRTEKRTCKCVVCAVLNSARGEE